MHLNMGGAIGTDLNKCIPKHEERPGEERSDRPACTPTFRRKNKQDGRTFMSGPERTHAKAWKANRKFAPVREWRSTERNRGGTKWRTRENAAFLGRRADRKSAEVNEWGSMEWDRMSNESDLKWEWLRKQVNGDRWREARRPNKGDRSEDWLIATINFPHSFV